MEMTIFFSEMVMVFLKRFKNGNMFSPLIVKFLLNSHDNNVFTINYFTVKQHILD